MSLDAPLSDAALLRIAAERGAGPMGKALARVAHVADGLMPGDGPRDGIARRVEFGPDSPLRPTAKAPRGQKRDEEHSEQARLFQWIAEEAAADPAVPWGRIFAVPNFAGFMGSASARKLAGARSKAEGRKKDVPDIFWPHARGGFVGVVLEMKSIEGTATAGQLDWIRYLCSEGWVAEVATSFTLARAVLRDYRALPRTIIQPR